jgi:hypothetical protein
MSEVRTEKRKAHEQFVRWQSHSVAQFGLYANVLLVLAAGELSVLFGVTYDAERIAFPYIVVTSGTALFFSVATGCYLALNRLRDFRATKTAANERRKEDGSEKVRKEASETAKRLGRLSWFLLWTQTALFALGSVLLFVATVRSALSHFPS